MTWREQNKVKTQHKIFIIYLHIQQFWSNNTIYLGLCFWPPKENKPFLLALFFVSTNL